MAAKSSQLCLSVLTLSNELDREGITCFGESACSGCQAIFNARTLIMAARSLLSTKQAMVFRKGELAFHDC